MTVDRDPADTIRGAFGPAEVVVNGQRYVREETLFAALDRIQELEQATSGDERSALVSSTDARWHTQSILGGSDVPKEARGDCVRACITSVLGIPLDAVENIHGNDWWARWQEFTRARGFDLVVVHPMAEPPQSLWIAVVPSLSMDANHAVVARGFDLVHDPGMKRRYTAEEWQALWSDNRVREGYVLVPLDPARVTVESDYGTTGDVSSPPVSDLAVENAGTDAAAQAEVIREALAALDQEDCEGGYVEDGESFSCRWCEGLAALAGLLARVEAAERKRDEANLGQLEAEEGKNIALEVLWAKKRDLVAVAGERDTLRARLERLIDVVETEAFAFFTDVLTPNEFADAVVAAKEDAKSMLAAVSPVPGGIPCPTCPSTASCIEYGECQVSPVPAEEPT